MKTIKITVSVPEDWSEQQAQDFFASQFKQALNRKAYQAKRNQDMAAFREWQRAQKNAPAPKK